MLLSSHAKKYVMLCHGLTRPAQFTQYFSSAYSTLSHNIHVYTFQPYCARMTGKMEKPKINK